VRVLRLGDLALGESLLEDVDAELEAPISLCG